MLIGVCSHLKMTLMNATHLVLAILSSYPIIINFELIFFMLVFSSKFVMKISHENCQCFSSASLAQGRKIRFWLMIFVQFSPQDSSIFMFKSIYNRKSIYYLLISLQGSFSAVSKKKKKAIHDLLRLFY